MRLAERDHALEEAENVAVLGKQVPIEPGSLIILVPRVVVTVLGVHELVARTEHRSPVRDHQDREEVFDLLFSQLHNLRWHALIALPSTVPAQVVVGTIVVIMAVGEVVLVVVRDQIIKAKPVVRSNIVDALRRVVGVIEVVRKQVAATIEPSHEVAHLACVSFDESANVVAELAVPLAP